MIVNPRTVPLEIGFDAPASVRDALATMGRTEDVRARGHLERPQVACENDFHILKGSTMKT